MAVQELYGPFDAGDGASLSENFWMDGLGPLLAGGDGVAPYVPNFLQVYSDSTGLQVKVPTGAAVIRGGYYATTGDDIILSVEANTSGTTRVDRVVLRHDRSANTIHPLVITGSPGGGAPAIAQGSSGGTLWDLKLAQVSVPNSASTIAPGNVLDERQYQPMQIPWGYTAQAVPSPAGPPVFYDLTSRQLLISNGSQWGAPVLSTSDTGWQAEGVTYHTAPGNYAEFRVIGSVCYCRFYVLGTSDSLALFAIPADAAPSRPLQFLVDAVDADVQIVEESQAGATVNVLLWTYQPWQVSIPSSAQAPGQPVAIQPLHAGRSPNGRTFSFSGSWPIG